MRIWGATAPFFYALCDKDHILTHKQSDSAHDALAKQKFFC